MRFSRSHALFVTALTALGWLCADIAPGDTGWPSSYPAWWHNGVIDSNRPVLNQGNDAPLSLGQLKHFAYEARKELNANLPNGAGTEIDNLVNGFTTVTPSNRAPATLGQLKAVAAPFYTRFAQEGFTPTSAGWPVGMELIDTSGVTDNSPLYPWLDDVTPSNAHIAIIGQAKNLFSFDLSQWTQASPAAPDNLQAYLNADGSLSLTWDDNSDNETGFLIEYSTDGGSTWNSLSTTSANTSSFTQSAGGPGTGGNATFRVSATNGSGSTPSNNGEGTETTLDPEGNLDGDALNNAEDAMPRDRELVWKRTPESNYVLIDLGELAGSYFAKMFISSGGHIATDSHAWSPTTSSWHSMLETDVVGIDRNGFVYGNSGGSAWAGYKWAIGLGTPTLITDYVVCPETPDVDWLDPNDGIVLNIASDSGYAFGHTRDVSAFLPTVWFNGSASMYAVSNCSVLAFGTPVFYDATELGSALWLDGNKLMLDSEVIDPDLSAIVAENLSLSNTAVASAKLPLMSYELIGINKDLKVKHGGSWIDKRLYEDLGKQTALTGTIQAIADDGTILTSDNKLWANGEATPLDDLVSNKDAYGPLTARDMAPNGLIVATAKKLKDAHGNAIPTAEQENHVGLLLKMEFVPSPGKVQSGFDSHLPRDPWTSVTAGQSSDVVRFYCQNGSSLKDVIKFKVEYPNGDATLENVNASGELLDAIGGNIFKLSGDYTEIPIVAKQHTSDGPKYADIVGMIGEGEAATEAARLKVVILAERTLRVHLITVIDSTSPNTQNFTVPSMSQLTGQLDEIYKQAAIDFTAGQTILSLNIAYDTNQNGQLDGGAEWSFMQDELRDYIRNNFEGGDALNNPSPDYFVIYYADSNNPSGLVKSDGTSYMQRGGNLHNGLSGSGLRVYGPFLESEGFNGGIEMSIAAAHELGHSLNLPFVIDPKFELLADEANPSLNDTLPNTTSGHDNFNFPNPDFSSDSSKRIWSVLRSGLYLGEEVSFNDYSKWLRKVHWSEANIRAKEHKEGGF